MGLHTFIGQYLLLKKLTQKSYFTGLWGRYLCSFEFYRTAIILYEISSIAAVNNELYARQGKGRVKKRMYQF